MKKQRIYIAGSFERRLNISSIADTLHQRGHELTSKWFTQPPLDSFTNSDKRNEEMKNRYNKAVLGVNDSTLLIVVFEPDLPIQGALVELGIACALKTITLSNIPRIISLGEPAKWNRVMFSQIEVRYNTLMDLMQGEEL